MLRLAALQQPRRFTKSKLRVFSTTTMSRRSQPPTPDASPRTSKRQRLEYEPLKSEDYKDGLMLAPMVRSGARVYATIRTVFAS